jgi:hypothetical protein
VRSILLSAALATSAYGQFRFVPPAAKQLEWKQPGACVVDFVKTPCRTVRWHQTEIESLGWIPDDSGVSRLEGMDAVDKNGSEVHTYAGTFLDSPLTLARNLNATTLLLRPEDKVASIDNGRRIFETQPGAKLRKWPYWEEDNDHCSNAASHAVYLTSRLPDSTVAGTHVVGYSGRDAWGTDYKVYFAPSVGCQEFSFQMLSRDSAGRITDNYSKIVDSYELGAPDPNLFRIPEGFQKVDSILKSR